MTECKYEGWVDRYLLNRLGEGERNEFEEHYFNCASCFAKTAERDEIVSVLKREGSVFATEERTAIETRTAAWYDRIVAFLTPKQWALAGAVAALLVAVLTVTPLLRNTPPEFIMNGEETVRGGSLTLISPVIDIKTVPAYFEWKKLGEDVEYQVSIYNGNLLWKTSTTDNKVSPPDDVKSRMVAGQRYSWQVKAFSKQGTLIAVSSRIRFTVNPAN
jgi:hypothetical protein